MRGDGLKEKGRASKGDGGRVGAEDGSKERAVGLCDVYIPMQNVQSRRVLCGKVLGRRGRDERRHR